MFISRDFIVAVFVAVIPLAVRAVASVGRSVRTAVLGSESSLSAFPFVVPGWVVSVHLKVTRGGGVATDLVEHGSKREDW